MSDNPKVLTGLMERRALATAFGELANITDPEQIVRRARDIAAYGDAATPVLVSMLDTSDPQLRGGLGQVAMRLDRNIIVPALRNVAVGRNSSDNARLSALTILDRYLHEPIDDALLSQLQDADELANQSLRELLHAMAQDPYAILEYLNQLAEQPPDVPHIILDAIPVADSNPHLVTLLRMLAQDPERALAREAVEQLGHIRSGQAVRALAGLHWVIPPDLGSLAERNARKLRMRGVAEDKANPEVEPWCAPPVTERVLLSPVDGAGAQLAWFIGPEDAGGRTRILSVITLDPAGVVACVEMRGVATAEMPERRAIGFVHHVTGRALPHPVELLEAPISAGIRTLNEGIARNVAGGAPTPLAFRLLNPVLWIEGLTADDNAPQDSMMPDAGDADAVAALLDHPAFRGWHWWPADLPAEARQGAPDGAGDARTFDPLRPALSRFGPEVNASYTRRLEAQSRWLTLAGDARAAGLARLAAQQLQAQPPEQASFVRRLTRAGREVAQLRDRGTM